MIKSSCTLKIVKASKTTLEDLSRAIHSSQVPQPTCFWTFKDPAQEGLATDVSKDL